VTASGCSVMVKDYGHLLAEDAAYATKAQRVSSLAKDISEVIQSEWARLKPLLNSANQQRVAYHPPCTMQHGLKLKGHVESMLTDMGYQLAPVADNHLCCGSAGTYSILQAALSSELKSRKLTALQAQQPALIATANIGCITQLQSGTETPVQHWIELLALRLKNQN
jgi:glycolate oxidase iron-sulfur subunit